MYIYICHHESSSTWFHHHESAKKKEPLGHECPIHSRAHVQNPPRCHQMNDRFMAHGNTLWSPGGARGENDIGQLLGPLVTIPHPNAVLILLQNQLGSKKTCSCVKILWLAALFQNPSRILITWSTLELCDRQARHPARSLQHIRTIIQV